MVQDPGHAAGPAGSWVGHNTADAAHFANISVKVHFKGVGRQGGQKLLAPEEAGAGPVVTLPGFVGQGFGFALGSVFFAGVFV